MYIYICTYIGDLPAMFLAMFVDTQEYLPQLPASHRSPEEPLGKVQTVHPCSKPQLTTNAEETPRPKKQHGRMHLLIKGTSTCRHSEVEHGNLGMWPEFRCHKKTSNL